MSIKISTIEIKLTNSDKVAIIDAKNQELLKHQYYLKSSYVARVQDKKTVYLHHDILSIKGRKTVKFKNKNHLDCREENLVVDEFKRLIKERKLARKLSFFDRVPKGKITKYRIVTKNQKQYLHVNVGHISYYLGIVSSDEEAQEIIHKLEER
jgi:hypothetical protein